MYLITVAYCGMELECRIPNEWMLISTILYFMWLILDNIDGKQARRTGTSSPLGLMFDHQVDALNVTITATYLATVFMTNDYAMPFWFIGALPFYYTTWEETYTGALNFPYFSAASDGCLSIGVLSFFIYLKTPEFFIYNRLFGVNYLMVLLIFSSGLILTISVNK